MAAILLAGRNFAAAADANNIPDLISNAVSAYQNEKYDQAIDGFSKLIALNIREAYYGRARAYYDKRDYDRAIADLNEVVKHSAPAPVLELRGNAFLKRGNYPAAYTDFTSALQLDPNNARLYVSRADAFFYEGSPANAFADYDLAIKLKSTDALAYAHRGELYAAIKGDYAKGIADCVESVRLDPNCWLGYNNLAALLTVCPSSKIRDGQRALLNARRACELTNWKNPLTLSVLAGAYAETHDYTDAINWQERSMDLEMHAGTLEPSAQTRLDLYQHHRPFHEKKS